MPCPFVCVCVFTSRDDTARGRAKLQQSTQIFIHQRHCLTLFAFPTVCCDWRLRAAGLYVATARFGGSFNPKLFWTQRRAPSCLICGRCAPVLSWLARQFSWIARRFIFRDCALVFSHKFCSVFCHGFADFLTCLITISTVS